MYRKSLALALALALSSIAPALAQAGDDLEKWDDRTTVEDDNTRRQCLQNGLQTLRFGV